MQSVNGTDSPGMTTPENLNGRMIMTELEQIRKQLAHVFCCAPEEVTGKVSELLREADSPQYPVYWGTFSKDILNAEL